MSVNVATHQTGAYRVATPVYEGPLDLLLQLIERAELDITRLALAQVTDQYLAHLREIQETAAEEVSAFLVIAVRLIQIKSEVLLPRPPVREVGEEDPGEALAMQLRVYKRYREIANLLAEREEAGLRTYLRLAPSPKVEGMLDLAGLGLAELVAAARAVLSQPDFRPQLSTVVAPHRITIREKIELITRILHQRGQATFKALLGQRRTRMEVVVTFLAVLELIKRRFITARQENLFGEIELIPESDANDAGDFELEFGE